jgi:hypothetical protein
VRTAGGLLGNPHGEVDLARRVWPEVDLAAGQVKPPAVELRTARDVVRAAVAGVLNVGGLQDDADRSF